MEKSKITYAQAIAEVEQILERFNNEQMNVDELGAQVKAGRGSGIDRFG